MPSIALPHQVPPFSTTLDAYLREIREAADAHERAVVCGITRDGDSRAQIVLRDAETGQTAAVTVVEEGRRTRIVRARLKLSTLALIRRGLLTLLGLRHTSVVVQGFFLPLLFVVVLASIEGSGSDALILLSVFGPLVVVGVLVFMIERGWARRRLQDRQIRLESLLGVFGRVGDAACVRPPVPRPLIQYARGDGVEWALRRDPRVSLSALERQRCRTIVGRISASAEPLHAPLSERPCAYYELRVYRRDDSTSRCLGHIRSERGFDIEDGTDRASFEPSAAVASVQFDRAVESDWTDLPQELKRAIKHAKLIREYPLDLRIRVEEAVLLRGQEVAVRGAWVSVADPDAMPIEGGYRAISPTRLRLDSTIVKPLLSSHSSCITP